MIEKILSSFPCQTHALFLVTDPDAVLADEAVLVELHARGFTLIQEQDPIALRERVEQARPWTLESPLLVVTPGSLDALPYDLWQQGHHVTLALHAFFPRLSYPELRALTPAQRARLRAAPAPPRSLGRRATRGYLLQHVFDADLAHLCSPADLLIWLDAYHRRPDVMPPALQETLLARLSGVPAYADWPLPQLLCQKEACKTFVQTQWERYLQLPPGRGAAEARVAYLDFAADVDLQNMVGQLVRSGTLVPVPDVLPVSHPAWADPGLLSDESERLPQRLAAELDAVQAALARLPDSPRWTDWQPFAWDWAKFTATYYHPDLQPQPDVTQAYRRLQQQVDARFSGWLVQRYAPLATQRLPLPHHLYHIPHYLAHQYAPDTGKRVALIVLDGLALADWIAIRRVWTMRHPTWGWQERLVLAQIPTLTSVSRQALVGGLCPRDFPETLTTPKKEPARWHDFWRGRDLDGHAAPYIRLRARDKALPAELTSTHSRALCAVDIALDTFVHHATLGSRDFCSSLRLWLQQDSFYLEQAIEALLAKGFVVALTGDHGHTEAVGIGQPQEGITAETRGKRARLYRDRRLAEAAQADFPDTYLWCSKGLLPDDVYALMPKGRFAFTTPQATVVSHGGMTLDEVVVPFVIIAP